MKLFGPLYDKAISWSRHQHAPYYLGALSFAESSFFPIPPDVMLIPMSTAEPHKSLRFALITTLASVMGGVAGYLLGVFALEMIEPWLRASPKYWASYQSLQQTFDQWGVWAVIVAGFSPIPYKLFTISAGALSLAFLPFVIASVIGRGARFFLEAVLIRWLGPSVEPVIRRYIERIGWATVVILLCVILIFKLKG